MAKKIKFPIGPTVKEDISLADFDQDEITKEALLDVRSNTPFGRYENDPKFRRDAKKFTLWAARRLGWPTMDIEIDERDFYSALEEATDEFSRLVHSQNIEDNLEAILGENADNDLTGRWVSSGGTGQAIKLARDYGGPLAGKAGGNVSWQRGYFKTDVDRQIYEKSEILMPKEVSKGEHKFVPVDDEIIVNRIFHHDIPSAVQGYYGGGAGGGFAAGFSGFGGFGGGHGTGLRAGNEGGAYGGGMAGNMDGFEMGSYHTMYPLYDSALSIQDFEMADMIYNSHYSFEIMGERIKIHPPPHTRHRIWVEFVFEDEALGVEVVGDSTARAEVEESIENVVSDFSDAPYDFIPYRFINAPGKRWIYRYALAVVKHKLGTVRSKFSDVPSPQDPFQLDGQDLKQDASDTMQRLIDNLRERLQSVSKEERLRRKAEMSENLNKYLSNVPNLIYRDNQ